MNSLFHVQFHLLNLSFADFILHLSSIFTPFHKLIASSNVVLLAHVSSTASALVNCMQTNRRHLLLHIHEQEYIAIIWLCLSVSVDLKYRQICSLVCLVSSIHSLVCFFHQFAPLLQCKAFRWASHSCELRTRSRLRYNERLFIVVKHRHRNRQTQRTQNVW